MEKVFDNDIAVLTLATRSEDSWTKMSNLICSSVSPTINEVTHSIRWNFSNGNITDFVSPAHQLWFNMLKFKRVAGFKPVVCNFASLETEIMDYVESELIPRYDAYVTFCNKYDSISCDMKASELMAVLKPGLESMFTFMGSADLDDMRECAGKWNEQLFQARKLYAATMVSKMYKEVDIEEWVAKLKEFYIDPFDTDEVCRFDSEFFQEDLFDTDEASDVLPYSGQTYTSLRAMTGVPGLIKGSTHIFGMPSGGGKTTLCSQLMVDAAIQHKHSLVVSTEIESKNYRARFISYASWKLTYLWMQKYAHDRIIMIEGEPRLEQQYIPAECPYQPIPYFLLKVDGLKACNWTDEAISNSEHKTLRMRDTMYFVYNNLLKPYMHYAKIEAVNGNWDACIQQANAMIAAADNGATLELVCLDWIGGSLDDIMETNGFDTRQAFINMASQFDKIAQRYKFAGVTTIQLNADAEGQKYPSISTFAECKSVRNRVVVAATVSALTVDQAKRIAKREADKGKEQMAADAIRRDNRFINKNVAATKKAGNSVQQGMCCGKSRYGDWGNYDVERNFDYQFFYKF